MLRICYILQHFYYSKKNPGCEINMCPPSDLASANRNPSPPRPDIVAVLRQSQICESAYKHAASLLAPAILNHSIRVYLYAKALAEHTSSAYATDPSKQDLLFTACLFHDIGTTSAYDGPQRFEVEGADAAVKHLSQYRVSNVDLNEVWTAIALHTSPGIAERIGELSRILRVAVITDFGQESMYYDTLVPLREELEGAFQRASIEQVLCDAVVAQAKQRPEKAPMVSWPGVLYEAWLAKPDRDADNKAFRG